MKQWLAILTAVVFVSLPVMVSAGEDTVIPPEANWSAMPPTPEGLVAAETRLASTAQEQASDSPRGTNIPVLSEDAKYQLVNSTVHDE